MKYQLSADQADFYETTFVPALFGAWARRLVDTVRPLRGQTVLDAACGTGAVARVAADVVGPSGSVVGLDLNEAMLDVARRIRPDVRWQQGDACALPCADDSFDLVVSQAGLMFFEDRAAALREMGRVAGPRGRVAVQVPGRLSHSPGYRALGSTLPDGYFAVGEPSVLRELFAAAGLRIDRFDTWMGATVLDSVDTFLAVELLPVSDEITPEEIERCRTALRPFVDSTGAVSAPIEVHLVVASPHI